MSRPPRLPPPPESDDINVIGARVRELNAKSALAAVAAARLLWQARALFPDTNAWLEWTAQTVGIGRRTAFRWARAADYHFQLEAAGLLDQIPSDVLSIMLLDAIADISTEQLLQFLDTIDLVNASVDEISAAADAFLGKGRGTQPFVSYRGPTPAQLVQGLDTEDARKRLNPASEFDLAAAHTARMNAALAKLSPEDIKAITEQYAAQVLLLQRHQAGVRA